VPLLARAWPRLCDGTLTFTRQEEAKASYCRRLVKADGGLDFAAPAPVLAARINGLFPWPGCSVEVNGVGVRVGLADALTDKTGEPGTVMGLDAEGLLVATGDGILRLRKLQRPGGRLLPAAEFLRGFPAVKGTRLPSQTMSSLVSAQPFR
jgi:methionyl-tRNA formyltransferase